MIGLPFGGPPVPPWYQNAFNKEESSKFALIYAFVKDIGLFRFLLLDKRVY